MSQHKVFIDENLMPALSPVLGKVYVRHKFVAAKDCGALGLKDVPLFEYLKTLEMDAIITLDQKQLEIGDERAGLRGAGLHWIGVPEVRGHGTQLLALLTAVVVSGMHNVLDHWAATPHAYHLHGPTSIEIAAPLIEEL
jgi:hypothetical protein